MRPEKRTPSGYAAGDLRSSDGTLYLVQWNGQMRRAEPKMTKAELKRIRR